MGKLLVDVCIASYAYMLLIILLKSVKHLIVHRVTLLICVIRVQHRMFMDILRISKAFFNDIRVVNGTGIRGIKNWCHEIFFVTSFYPTELVKRKWWGSNFISFWFISFPRKVFLISIYKRKFRQF